MTCPPATPVRIFEAELRGAWGQHLPDLFVALTNPRPTSNIIELDIYPVRPVRKEEPQWSAKP